MCAQETILSLQTGRPASTEGRLEKEIRCYDLLDQLNIPYERVHHEAMLVTLPPTPTE